MITAKDINTMRFEQARPGYKTEEVEEFLKKIADQITAMTKEKEDSEKKIEVLVENIRRYKADEEALKDAMIGAQKQARLAISEAQEKAAAIISEAQAKAEQIISAANVKSDEIIGSTSARAAREQEKLYQMQTAVRDFKHEILSMYRSHLELITSLPEEEYEEVQTAEAAEEVQQVQPDTYEDMDSTKVIDTAAINEASKISQ